MKQYYNKSLLLIIFTALLFNFNGLLAQTQLGNTILGGEKLDGTGDAVAMNGDGSRIVVSANFKRKNNLERVGEVSVYELQNNNWVQLGATISGNAADEEFGTSVDINDTGNRIVVSSKLGIKVYDFVSENWQLNAGYATFPEYENEIGQAINVQMANNGATIAFANSNFPNGIIVIYEEVNDNWQKKGSDIPYDAEYNYVAISKNGNRLAIPDAFEIQPTPFQTVYYGNLKIYDFEGNNWVEKQTIKIADSLEIATSGNPGLELSDGFDFSADGSRIVFVTIDDESSSDDKGYIHTFDLVGSVWQENVERKEIIIGNPMSSTVKLSDNGQIVVLGITEDIWFEDPNYVALYQLDNQQWKLVGDEFDGSGRDESANRFVDISNDGSRMMWGGKENIPGDSIGFVKVYDYSPILPVIEHTIAKSISIYPNPTHRHIHVSIDDENIYKLVLIDVEGRLVRELNYKNKSQQISLIGIESGVYLLNIYDKDLKRVVSKKVVKL